MTELRRINSSIDISLTEEFLASSDPRGLYQLNESEGTKVVRDDIQFGLLDTLVADTISTFKQFDTAMDESMTCAMHKLLPLTRRQASDQRMWAWLGIVRYPEFVAHRWEPSSMTGLRTQNRFFGSQVRQTFARLWWAAELTVGEEGDYSLTEKLLALSGFQDGYEAMFGRAFCQYRPALEAFIDVVGPESGGVIRTTSKEFGYILTTMVLESMSKDQISGLLTELVAKIKAQ